MADHRAFYALSSDVLEGRIDRRALLKRAGILGLAAPALAGLIAACDDGDDDDLAAEPDEPVDDEDIDEEALDDLEDEDVVPEDAEVDIDEVADIPRERTLFLRWGGQEGRFVDHDLWNGYAIGANHQNGLGILYEPLAYYSAFADETYPWLAEDWEYNDDSTELTINLRSGIEWSDGEPFTAEDVAFTLNHLGR
jgi:peptide/nickel transport system substrate-binding protein